MSSPKAKLIIVSAPSGAGKTTLCNRLLQTYPEHLVLSVSSTTRAPRAGESDGKHYHFLSTEDFKSGIDSGQFVEWANVHGNFYGTSKKTLTDSLDHGKSVLLDIDVQGAEQLWKEFAGSTVSVFIAPPSIEELENRLRSRGTDADAVIQRRLENAKQELARKDEFDLVIVNDDLDRAYDEFFTYIQKSLGLPKEGHSGIES